MNDKKEEDAIYFEHQESYKAFADSLRTVWLKQIFSLDAPEKEPQELPEDYMDLLGTIGKDRKLLCLYAASGITLCTEEGRRFGIPEDILSDIRRKGFLKLSEAEAENEIYETAKDVSKRLKCAYQKYSVQNYSYPVKRAVNVIHSCRYEKLSASVVAEKSKVERTYLAKIFKAETGQTLTEYIRQVKMELAEELLQTDAYHLTEIAELLGYTNYPYFSKQFKEYFGVAPDKYSNTKQ